MQVLGALLLTGVLAWPGVGSQPTVETPDGQSLHEENTPHSSAPLIQASEANEASSPAPGVGAASPLETEYARPRWPEIWGLVGARGFVDGERMAPNGHAFDPLFALDLDLNIGLLPNQRLYLFTTSSFWAEKQGGLDFSKREWDFTGGVAWNIAGPVELRAFGYALNNLNRGVSVTQPSGYADGAGIEGRWYLPTPDRYDVGKRSFLAVGYLPTKVLIDANGNEFPPGLFARAYLTWDLPAVRSYVFLDVQGITDNDLNPRLLLGDGGLAIRPFLALPALEFRLGATDTFDVRVGNNNRVLVYGAIRILF